MKETVRILKMLEQGKLSAEEAEELLQSIDKKVEPEKSPGSPRIKGKKLKIKVESKGEDGDNVNISVPLSLAKLMARFVPKEQQKSIESAGVDLGAALEHIEELETMEEDIVNIESQDGDKVRIYIE